MQHQRLLIQIEGAIIAAFAVALEYIPHTVGPSAIEVSFGIIPIVIYSLRRGAIPGMVSGLIWGLLDLILRGLGNGSVLNVWQGLLEFTIAFMVVGLAGILQRPIQASIQNHTKVKTMTLLLMAAFFGTFAKYFCHFLAGAVYWGSYAPKGMNAWLYSLTVNGGSFIASFILTGIVLCICLAMVPKLYLPKDMVLHVQSEK
ncbi:energy-coupled thiamine transporter ThiT [Latilactobacillus curvatus]|uniref:energy-coupled thiamine transporter ThiT n=1 Tax=Latilactobacillus curvatus TaxID=28038 RepID=UPI0020C76A97|nr:energy-coupled thiamine transporter ThiT [Latilactobacillus curvatus]MCP8860992.1 energy-coupled thiamine transporter ThiT [Latilactobacillus curvatus]MCP8867549.1 energy-coupled thiamine transporter ThiT [Latilactobacillus curvatus]MCP8871098.1 energy-coupled thiamine transporter ThiT [Latilactobacillus curvatus]MCP8880118.1 energy-coupled thiamine transporter ThiT [Latilactobacillus curvatus]